GALRQRAPRRNGRAGDRCKLALQALRGHARAERLERRDLPGDGGSERERAGSWLHRGSARMQDREPGTLGEARGGRAGYGRARGVRAGYGRSVVLEDVDFDLRGGERIAVLGPNGGGKSTLFRLLLGELEPFGGELVMNGAGAFVPQTERSRLDYPVSALDVAL